MTSDLRDRLDDLLVEVPAHVHADSGTAWRAGARRRVRRRVASGGAVLAVLALVGIAGAATHRAVDPPPAGSTGTRPSASSYPTRIDAPLLRMGTLPDRAGPIAGLVLRDQGWVAVGQRGQLWRIPGATGRTPLDAVPQASISPDGTWIAYVDRPRGVLTLRDLVQGNVDTPDIGGSGHDWVIRDPEQSFWSPDSTRLLVAVRRAATNVERGLRVDALVVTPGGSQEQEVTAPSGRHVEPIGWLSDTRLGWLRWTTSQTRPDFVITGTQGRRVLSASRSPVRISENAYVTASPLPSAHGLTVAVQVSTASRQLLVSNAGRPGDTGLVGSHAIPNDRTLGCRPSWSDSYPVVPYRGAPGDHLLWTGPGSYAVQVDPALGPVYCSVWSYDALRGHAHGGLGAALFGDRTDWLSWHWRQMGLGAAAVLVLLAGVAGSWLRRRRTRRLTAATTSG